MFIIPESHKDSTIKLFSENPDLLKKIKKLFKQRQKSLLIMIKIIALNTELQNKQVDTIESKILDKWCKIFIKDVPIEYSLKLIKKLNFKLSD